MTFPMLIGIVAIAAIVGFFLLRGRTEPVSCIGLILGCILISMVVLNWNAIGQAVLQMAQTQILPIRLIAVP
ncbi:hypothetical protein EPA93_17720 [Ktedonosporobacter rubrisoli]|uniref:Uncharacterized protein n=1 Tax=Ktedonosporobacter rubrisoli TaxID=2509675 RepID=A0A4P6JRA7_KTERU|nr:hypothetical protein [Ktedonosporobacter rubrisoli]QBD77730.1 hypothetical protein EPA93_17720 [Ktedonosporobacter rubrisoli]